MKIDSSGRNVAHYFIHTKIHTYILSVNKYDICWFVCVKADPSVGAAVLQ